MNIDPNKNHYSGFFYLAKHKDKEEFAKTSPRKKTIIFDLAGVLVAFADPKAGGISSAQCVEIALENKPKQFVYFWERPDLHWFLNKLRGQFEIILWSSLSALLTKKIVDHIQRKDSYFAYVLSKADSFKFEETRPTSIALARVTLESIKTDTEQKNLMDVSFNTIDPSLYPKKRVKDFTLLLKNRDLDSILAVDCAEDGLIYMKNNAISVCL